MNNELQVFHFESNQVRILLDQEGQPWWVAKDACDVLGIGNSRQSLSYLDDDEKGVITNDTLGGLQEMAVINEPGLYSLVLRSRKPEARRFKRWVTHEILPAVRKHGGYLTEQKLEEALRDPDILIRLAQNLKAEQTKRKLLQAKVERDHPKVFFAESVSASHTSILIGDLAKILRQNGYQIGQNRFFEWLRTHGYLIRANGTSWNMPTQRAMEMGLFEVRERTINNRDGSVRIIRTPKITGKGQVYFINKILGKEKGHEAAWTDLHRPGDVTATGAAR